MSTVVNSMTVKIGGAAGEGIMVSGLLFSKACVRGGLKAFDYTEYPSLIRGGHNVYLTQVSEKAIWSHDRSVEILIAFDQQTIDLHIGEMSKGGAIIYDAEDRTISIPAKHRNILRVPVPLKRFAEEIAGNLLMRNSVALGAAFALCEFPLDHAVSMIRDIFSSKGSDIISKNVDTLQAGYEKVSKDQQKKFNWKIVPKKPRGDMVVTGNEAIALGAIAGGCKFYVAYPMTPATSILSYLAEQGPKYGMVVKHAEDEISVINMAIGAGHMGVRSVCGTSGGGFALMVEGYGMAAMTETPCVIINAQRPGPSTGLPTWTGQADLLFILHASQGDFPRFVVAPGDVEECFALTVEAMNVAEEYQTPVILLTDKHLAECHQTIRPFDISAVEIRRGKRVSIEELKKQSQYKRYDSTAEDGISPRSFPGMRGGIYLANSDEHDAFGYTIEDSVPVKAMMDKRQRKLGTFLQHMPKPKIQGADDAAITFVFWGSAKGAVREAISKLSEKGISANYLQITWLSPFPAEAVKEILHSVKRPIIVENNMQGQLASLIHEQTGFAFHEKILKYDGRPFFPEEIVEQVKK